MTETRLRVDSIIDEYLSMGDNAKENANMSYGPSGMLFTVGGEGLKKDYLKRMKEAGFEKLVSWHDKGKVHIHDLSLGVIVPYCAGHSLMNLITDGLDTSSVKSSPAKHFSSIINHMVNYIGANANDFAGAQAFNDIDLYLAPYAYKAYLDYKKMGCSRNIAFRLTRKTVYQEIQSFIFHLNYNSRWGNQSPFSNITLSITVPDDMKEEQATVGGRPVYQYFDYMEDGIEVNNHTYGDMVEWQQLIIDAILDTYLVGDAEGKSFTFPVLTINVTEDFFNMRSADKICELANKFGTPFFQNYINGIGGGQKMSTSDVRSMCCRLSLNMDDLKSHTGGIFGNADNTGSIQVVTVNLPYIAKEYIENGSNNINNFYKEITQVMEEIRDEQLWKRKIVDRYFERGFFELAKQNFRRGFDTFFTTIGFIGLWECIEMLINDEKSFITDEGIKLAQSILNYMKEECNRFMKETDKLYNFEAVPAEGATYKLAKKSLKQFPDIKHRGLKKAPYFTNSCHLPVEYQNQLYLIFETQNKLQTIPTGGTVTHFTTGEEMTTEETKEAIRTICQTNIPFFSINSIFSICPICGYQKGKYFTCPNKHSEEDLINLYKKDPSKFEFK